MPETVALDAPMRSVAVVGGGIVGWSAAAALKRRLPALQVTIVPVSPPANALADRMTGTLPSIIGFHDDIGLREEDAVIRAGGSRRLGTLFEGWVDGLPAYVHAYGTYGQPFGTSSFHHHWVRAAHAGSAAPFDDHSAAAALARAGRLVPSDAGSTSPFAGLEYGLTLDVNGYRTMLAAFARHVGVAVRDGVVEHVRLRPDDGFIEAVALTDGGLLYADLFIDATGPVATVRGVLDAVWEDWSRWLPCDRLLRADATPTELTALDRVIAEPAGWRWITSAPTRTHHGVCYAGAHMVDEAAARLLHEAGASQPSATISFRQGSRPEPWRRNCVAIGDAATAVEPLEWTNLHLAHSAIDRIVAMMPGRACAPVEVADYNRQTAAEVMRVRDFVIVHYAAARRSEPFWQAAPPPDSLARTLDLFAERGRLPFFEEETFARDSWLAVLLGQGTIPRRVDPLIDTVPPARSDAAMAGHRAAIRAALPSLPTASAFHAAQWRQIAR